MKAKEMILKDAIRTAIRFRKEKSFWKLVAVIFGIVAVIEYGRKSNASSILELR